jgi:hypothetical protein
MQQTELPRRIDLGDGRALVLRAGRHDDVDGLAALYSSLSDDDVYLRFFSAHRPERDLFERMVRIDQEGGALLVVALDDPTVDGPPRLVADAWFSRLPDGNGEFAITVAEGWRGWLGAHLLDALVTVAASRGVPNLEAEVLLRNRAMLAMVRRRGCVRLGDDGSTVRVAIATTGDVPSWPPIGHRPRVLVEGRTGWAAQDAVTRAGKDVAICAGPLARRGECPVLRGGTCPLVDGADVIVVSLASSDERLDELLRAHRARTGAAPVVVEAPSTATTTVPEGTRVIPTGADERTVLAAVDAALAEARPADAP